MKRSITIIITTLILLTSYAMAEPLGTGFTYQGELNFQGARANGTFDFEFTLFEVGIDGVALTAPYKLEDVNVQDGVFSVELDFGTDPYTGEKLWLDIAIREGDSVGGYTGLLPRQPITRTPFSIQTRGIVVDENNNVGIGTSTPTHPLHVETDSTIAIYGRSKSPFIGDGGWFESEAPAGSGVHALNSASSGFTNGVSGNSESTSGVGVRGQATASSGITSGGLFISTSVEGRGVYGRATATSGTTYGGWFESRSTTGRGVYSHATATTGINYGGWFQSDSTRGRGINGFATATSGVNYAVVGHSNSSDGYDFWASGAGTDYGSNSSRRWKSNVVLIGDPLAKLAQIRGVYFDWDAEHGGAHDVGMIAEEVGAVMPEIVQYEENGIDAIGMDYSRMTPLLVEAVNALSSESNRRLAEKDDEISELRQQLSDLQQIVERLASEG